MEDAEIYNGLKRFAQDPIWTDYLRPKLQAWQDAKRARVETAKTPGDLWDARNVAQTAEEVLPILDGAMDEFRVKLKQAVAPPARAL